MFALFRVRASSSDSYASVFHNKFAATSTGVIFRSTWIAHFRFTGRAHFKQVILFSHSFMEKLCKK
jgi:hypothetical protein